MGIAKRMWEEEQERVYSSNDGITVCSGCFEEHSIQQFIEEHQSHNSCSYCDESGDDVKACDLDSVIEHILESISYEWGHPANEGLPYESREGGWQVATVCDTWELLEDIEFGNDSGNLYEDICSSIHNQEWCEKNPYSLSADETLMHGWREFSDFVQNTARYVFFKAKNSNYDENQHDEMNPIDILDSLGSIYEKIKLVQRVPASTEIKRVRIVNLDQELSSAKELGSPPKEFATMANRMSPAGISMFYGAFDIDTAIKETYESRPDQQKKAICGIFKPIRDLTVIDLSERFYMPSLFDEHERENRSYIRFLIDFVSDFTKPIQREDRAHIDYVPTQIITEYFRHLFKHNSNGIVDGVIYPSSKNEGKKAIVIFANSDQCVEKTDSLDSNSLLSLIGTETHALP
jgi:hypothetical protein